MRIVNDEDVCEEDMREIWVFAYDVVLISILLF